MRAFVVCAALLFSAQVQAQDRWLGPDKALHFGVSVGISFGAYSAATGVTKSLGWRIGMGVGVALAAGGAKELYDLGGRGDPSWKDFTWDALGALTGTAIAFLMDHFLLRDRHPQGVQDLARQPVTARGFEGEDFLQVLAGGGLEALPEQ